MNRLSFLATLKQVITGGGNGFRRSTKLPVTDLKTAAGLTLTAGTNPLVAALETNAIGVQWAAGNSTAALLNWTVPLDYDQVADSLNIAFMAVSNGVADAPGIDASIYRKRASTALSTDLDPTISGAIPKTGSTNGSVVSISVLNKGLRPKDVLTILIAPGTHATDAVNVYGIDLQYRSTLRAFNDSDV